MSSIKATIPPIRLPQKQVASSYYNLRRREIEEKLVRSASLTPRERWMELDDAMEQARRDAAPYAVTFRFEKQRISHGSYATVRTE